MCLSHLIYTVLPCLIHTYHAAPMPSPTVPLFLRPRHSTAVERLLARVQLLPAATWSSTKLSSDAYQSQMQVASVKPNTVCMDEEKGGRSTLQKRLSRTNSFRLPCGHSQRTRHCRSRAGARQGMCECTAWQRNGMGAACRV